MMMTSAVILMDILNVVLLQTSGMFGRLRSHYYYCVEESHSQVNNSTLHCGTYSNYNLCILLPLHILPPISIDSKLFKEC